MKTWMWITIAIAVIILLLTIVYFYKKNKNVVQQPVSDDIDNIFAKIGKDDAKETALRNQWNSVFASRGAMTDKIQRSADALHVSFEKSMILQAMFELTEPKPNYLFTKTNYEDAIRVFKGIIVTPTEQPGAGITQ